jgi:hypothetical protein
MERGGGLMSRAHSIQQQNRLCLGSPDGCIFSKWEVVATTTTPWNSVVPRGMRAKESRWATRAALRRAAPLPSSSHWVGMNAFGN